MGVSLAKNTTSPAAARPGVSLEKHTPGRIALAEAVAAGGPGLKFVSVRHWWEWSSFDVSAEVLYGGGNTLMTGGREGSRLAQCWAVMDAAMNRGRAHLAVVTLHPGTSMLTVARFSISPKAIDRRTGEPVRPAVEHVREWTAAEYGDVPDAFEQAEKARYADDQAHIDRVMHILSVRELSEGRVREPRRLRSGDAPDYVS